MTPYPTLANGGATTKIGSFTLSKGRWLLLYSGWAPFTYSTIPTGTTGIEFIAEPGFNTGVMGSSLLFKVTNMTGMATVRAAQAVVNIKVTNWENETPTMDAINGSFAAYAIQLTNAQY